MNAYLGTSPSGQFMFQSFLGAVGEFAGALVFSDLEGQQVFLPRASYPVDWTEWRPPDQVSNEAETQFRLLHGRPIGKGVGGPVTVWARFKAGTYREWLHERLEIVKAPKRSDLPDCPLKN